MDINELTLGHIKQ